MPRLAIGIEYDGTGYCGWQRQDHALSIQQVVEEALSRVADATVAVNAAGRTDAGVHARGQVAHFDTDAERAPRAWLLGTNSNLPPDVSVSWVATVADDFDARYSAVARTYEYLILNRAARSALHHHRAWWVHGALDVAAMQAAAPLVLGEHDFSAFRAAQCQARSPRRDLQLLEVRREGAFIRVTCRANAFLHHMVRNLVGSLVRIGRGEERPGWLREVLEGRDRRAAGMTAAACGLYLARVHYPAACGLPAPGEAPAHDL
jgi:tRNA pseudouridine38-40 synthase